MLVVMRPEATAGQIEAVTARVRELGYEPHAIRGAARTAIGVVGNNGMDGRQMLARMPGVQQVIRITTPYKLVSRQVRPDPTVVSAGPGRIGGGFAVIAGPCAVENEARLLETAEFLKSQGVKFLRGGAYKPRTSPYSFQGLGADGLKLLAKARERTGMGIVTEVMDVESVPAIEEVADVLQIGTRNMQNYALLKRVAKSPRPVLLKRGMSATLEEWLMAAEYVMAGGNANVILCERGVRTFGDHARSTLDLSIVPAAKQLTHLPVIVDPSHAAGRAEYVPALALAALAVGADGLLVEVHPEPTRALSDAAQAVDFTVFAGLMQRLRAVATALGVRLD